MNEPKRVDFKPAWMKESDAHSIDDCFTTSGIPLPDEPLKEVIKLNRYRHRKSGDICIISEFIPMCDGKHMVDGVLYMYIKSQTRLVRTVESFRELFEEVKE